MTIRLLRTLVAIDELFSALEAVIKAAQADIAGPSL